ncbi:MAG: mechanosensitive ion channel [Planctomycetota bacterium]|nr:mechanosensitive ion channel [Planctomycetota bacterium]
MNNLALLGFLAGEQLDSLLDYLPTLVPALGVLALMVVVLPLAHRYLLGTRSHVGTEQRLPRQLGLIALTLLGLLFVIVSLPLETETRGQILSLVGLAFTAVIALSSTTFVSNAMAGLMLRSIRSFRPGDFIKINDTFGRVTERGLFHVEIQSEDRDLITMPNMNLVTNPVKVVRASGTVVSVKLSLGYDAPRGRIEAALKKAAEATGLRDAYVHVKTLGDFSVTYMVAGFLDDIDRLLTTRSRLRTEVIDALHHDDIEIVSPTFMNQRPIDADKPVLPQREKLKDSKSRAEEPVAEDVAFDKAHRAAELEKLRDELNAIVARLKKGAEPEMADSEREELKARMTELEESVEELTQGLNGD